MMKEYKLMVSVVYLATANRVKMVYVAKATPDISPVKIPTTEMFSTPRGSPHTRMHPNKTKKILNFFSFVMCSRNSSADNSSTQIGDVNERISATAREQYFVEVK